MCETAKNATNTTERKMPNTVLKYLPWTQFAFQNKNKNNKTKRQKIKKQTKTKLTLNVVPAFFPSSHLQELQRNPDSGKLREEGKTVRNLCYFYPCQLVVLNVRASPPKELVLF